MKQIIIKSSQLQTPPLGLPHEVLGRSRGAYIAPAIEIISLDNEISLALESIPYGPGEEIDLGVNQQHVDPFQTNLG